MFYDPLDGPVELPSVVRSLVGSREYELVWVNQLGGLTLRIRDGSSNHFLKWMPVDSDIDLGVGQSVGPGHEGRHGAARDARGPRRAARR